MVVVNQGPSPEALHHPTNMEKPPKLPHDDGDTIFLQASPPRSSLTIFLFVIVSVAAITGFMMGYDLSIVAVVLDPVRSHFDVCEDPNVPCFKSEVFVAILPPGAMISSLMGGWASDKFGRRAMLIVSDAFFVLAGILMFVARSYGTILVGRFLLGVGIGLGFVVFPSYMAEVSPAEIRGALGMAQEIAQCSGVLFAYGLSALVSPSSYWRILLLSAGIPAVLQLIGSLILPESPRWLVSQKRVRDAKEALECIAGLRPVFRKRKIAPKDDEFDRKELLTSIDVGDEILNDLMIASPGEPKSELVKPKDDAGRKIEARVDAQRKVEAVEKSVEGDTTKMNELKIAAEQETETPGGDPTDTTTTAAAALQPSPPDIPFTEGVSRKSSKNSLLVSPNFSANDLLELALIESVVQNLPSNRNLEEDSSSDESRVSRVRATRAIIAEARITSNPSLLLNVIPTLTRGGDIDEVMDDSFDESYLRPDEPIALLLGLIEDWVEREEQKQMRRRKRRRRNEEELKTMQSESRSKFKKIVLSIRGLISKIRPDFMDKMQGHGRSLMIAIGCGISNDLIGAGTLLYYSVDLMSMFGICNPVFAGVMIGVIKFVGVIILMLMLESVGRRLPLLIGSIGLMICHFIQAINQMQDFPSCINSNNVFPTTVSSSVFLSFFLLIMAFWSISWSGLMFVVSSEVLPSSIRGLGMGITISIFWMIAFAFQLFFRPLIASISAAGAFAILGLTSAVVVLFTYFFVPELTGLALENVTTDETKKGTN